MIELMGSLRPEGELRALRIERRLNATPADVWSALTEPERIARWLAQVEWDLRVGGEYALHFDDASQRGRILALEPGSLLELSWAHEGAHESVVRFEVRPDGDGTLLVLDHRGLPGDEAAGHAGGWQAHLEALDGLFGGPGRDDWWGRYRELKPLYEEQEARL